MEYVFYLIIIASFIFFYFKKDTANETISKELKQQISDQNNQIIILSKDNSTQKERVKTLEISLKENKEQKEEEKTRLTQEFENLANRILDENSNKFQKQNKKEIDSLLKPLNEKIKDFQEKVEETNKEDIKRNSSLITQIENLQKLNNQLSSDATNLTKALKGESKTQGDWGEYQLEVLLEKVGLQKDIHFSTQGGYRDENGNLKKPDFIINLPDNKHLIIDSKVSLTAYEDYYNEEQK